MKRQFSRIVDSALGQMMEQVKDVFLYEQKDSWFRQPTKARL
jgi:hypothetical protein